MNGDGAANWRIVCLAMLAAFLGLSVAAFTTGLLPGDLVMRQEVLDGQSTLAYHVARVVDHGGKWHVLLPAMVLLLLWSPQARRHWWLWIAVLLGSAVIEHTFKLLVGRPRPSGFALGFPSGHATAAAS